MKVATRLSAYGLAVACVAAGAWAVGAAVGPVTSSGTAPAGSHSMNEMGPGGNAAGDSLPGLAVAANGYRLVLDQDIVTAGRSQPFRFRILGPEGTPVTRFAVEHDKRLHLVLVRRDTSGYQHVHPDMGPDGTWSVPLTLPTAGTYRLFTDFTPEGGRRATLGADLQVAGDYQPARFDGPVRTSTVDEYEVRLDGDLTPGHEASVTASVTLGGTDVTDLQPYLGAGGHLVALRAADLGYLHVHPAGAGVSAGPRVRFAVDVPTAGRYRLFFDFQHNGRVRTAEFTVDTKAGS
jgi:hypothetical protein